MHHIPSDPHTKTPIRSQRCAERNGGSEISDVEVMA
jgi:hypothetical protein